MFGALQRMIEFEQFETDVIEILKIATTQGRNVYNERQKATK